MSANTQGVAYRAIRIFSTCIHYAMLQYRWCWDFMSSQVVTVSFATAADMSKLTGQCFVFACDRWQKAACSHCICVVCGKLSFFCHSYLDSQEWGTASTSYENQCALEENFFSNKFTYENPPLVLWWGLWFSSICDLPEFNYNSIQGIVFSL